MNTDFLKDNWKKLAVKIGKECYALKDKYMMCLGYHPNLKDALLFDVGGMQGAEANLYSVGECDALISHDPFDVKNFTKIGELVDLSDRGIAVVGATYRHYKGVDYKLLKVATDVESGVDLVIYCEEKDPTKVWARAYHIFLEK